MARSKSAHIIITLPYAPYRITIEDPWGRSKVELVTVSLAKNNQLRMGGRNQALVREAKRQMREDTGNLMARIGWPEMRAPLVMDATIVTRTKVRKDDDGGWTALYPARDAIAEALGCNDADIITGKISWKSGLPEETIIEMRGA